MNPLAIVALGTAALLVHVALTVLATPLLIAGAVARPAGSWRRAGWAWPLIDPYRSWSRPAERALVRSHNASVLSSAAPLVSLGLTASAALLVPSFATGMLDSPLADLPLILTLLVTGRLVCFAAACDPGLARSGLAAVGGVVDGLLVLPGVALAAAMLFLLSGSTLLDVMLSGQRGMTPPGGLACAASLALAALAGGGRTTTLSQDLSGADLVLFRIEAGLRRLVWIDLVGGLLWPGSLAPAQSGPMHWVGGLLAWALRLALLSVGLAMLDGVLDRAGNRRRLAGLSLLAALLAPILLLAGQGAG